MSAGRGVRVTDVLTVAGTTPAEVLRLAGALADAWPTAHPVLRAIAAAAEPATGGTPAGPAVRVGGDGVVVGSAEVRDLSAEPAPGTGVSGVVRVAHSGLQLGQRVLVGSRAWLAAEGVEGPAAPLARACATAEAAGATAVLVAWNGSVRAVLTLRD